MWWGVCVWCVCGGVCVMGCMWCGVWWGVCGVCGGGGVCVCVSNTVYTKKGIKGTTCIG